VFGAVRQEIVRRDLPHHIARNFQDGLLIEQPPPQPVRSLASSALTAWSLGALALGLGLGLVLHGSRAPWAASLARAVEPVGQIWVRVIRSGGAGGWLVSAAGVLRPIVPLLERASRVFAPLVARVARRLGRSP